MKNKKIVVVTGGTRGIGLAITKQFIKNGDKVYITYLKSTKSYFKEHKIFKSKNLKLIKCDMRQLSQIKSLKKILKKEGRVDVLVNNVGDVIRRSPFEKSDDKLWMDVFNLNTFSTIRTTLSLLPLIKKSSDSVIVNISSTAGRAGGAGDSLHYGVSKSAINVFTVGLAKELKRDSYKTRVVAIAPSLVDTDFQKRNSTPERLAKILKATPIARMAYPSEVADLVYLLTSKKASYISGEVIYLSGGR